MKISAPCRFYLYQQTGAYRSADGAVTALLLLLLCFMLFTVMEKLPGTPC
jgi:thiamine transport system permease protein